MLVLLSPAKLMNFDPPSVTVAPTAPELKGRTAELAKTAKKLKKADLKRLMGISDDLAALNYERFQAFDAGAADGKPAILTFAGDVYRGLDAASLNKADLDWAQDRVRILSGLYGLLRPLDAVQPYRLEMGSRLKNPKGATLYDFWGAEIAGALNAALAGRKHRAVVNLASNEYAKAVDRKTLDAPLIDVAFKEIKDGKTRSLMLYAKQARGMMARWIIENRVEDPAKLKDFDAGGYRLDKAASTETSLVFTRPQPKPKKG